MSSHAHNVDIMKDVYLSVAGEINRCLDGPRVSSDGRLLLAPEPPGYAPTFALVWRWNTRSW